MVPAERRAAPPWARARRRAERTRASGPKEPRPESSAEDRFRRADRYRAEREWLRYEGTAQRALWRELRERFLGRHARNPSWAVDLGSGPGRFTRRLGGGATRTVALDLSAEMLRLLGETVAAGALATRRPERVLGNAVRPPLAPGAFGTVAVLGNALGFAAADADRLFESAISLVAPGGVLLLEVAPGPGESSRYLTRLPPKSVARLLRAPVAAVRRRLDREGFRAEPARRSTEGSFRRIPAREAADRLDRIGWHVEETVAVAPALGSDPERLEATRPDPKAWGHLLALEEGVGREPERWPSAAAVLLAARRPGMDGQD